MSFFLVVNAVYFKEEDFEEEFDCPKNCVLDGSGTQSTPNCSDLWPLNEQFECVYNSFRLLFFLFCAMYGLLGLMIIVLVIGLIWSCVGRHATELGAIKVAEFCFNSCLHPEAFLVHFVEKSSTLGPNIASKTEVQLQESPQKDRTGQVASSAYHYMLVLRTILISSFNSGHGFKFQGHSSETPSRLAMTTDVSLSRQIRFVGNSSS